jgi:type VI secretion system protein ImpL
MKQTIVNTCKKQFIPLVLLLCSAILIWINGPILKIGHSTPLLDPMKRLYTIILVILAWLLKFIFIDNAPKKTSALEKPTSPEAQKKLQHLQGRFYGAIEFLKKTIIDKQGKNLNLSRLPWYLFIGPTGSGKTTLLANSNINFILSKQFKVESTKNMTPSDNCDWWITRDVVLIDVPGSYLTTKTKDAPQSAIYHYLWRQLLSLIKKCHGKDQLQGIVIALHLPEIIKQERSQKNQIIYDIKKRIMELTDQFGKQLPIHLIITKCDLLPGFTEFFGECSSDEINQTWGITLDGSTDSVIDTFNQRFNALIKRVNKQLIWRLHQERNPNARPYIKDFPLHLERLKETITQLLKALMLPNLPLQGVFLTSSSQEYADEETSYVAATGAPAHFNTQALQIMSAPPMPARSYFVRQLILNTLFKTPNQTESAAPTANWKRRIVYATSASAIITATFFLGHDFQLSIQQAYSIQNDLNNYQLSIQQANQATDRLANALPLLNALQHAANHSADKLSLAYYSNKSKQTASRVYQQTLQKIVLPEIKSFFEKYLQTANTQNPENVYGTLKAYLMLSDKEHFQGDYIAKALQQVMPTAAKQTTIAALIPHIQAALNNAKAPLKLDENLITETRKALTNLPSAELGFVILKNMSNNNMDSAISLGTHSSNPPIFLTKSVETIVPTMYTAQNFQSIMADEAHTAATEATQGNWVLGINLIVTSQATINALAAQLRTQYIANYVDIWESLLANLQLATPQNLVEMNNLLGTLTSSNSPLLQLLNTVKENTSFTPILTASPKLQSLSVLLVDTDNHETSALYQIFTNLQKLHAYLNTITDTNDSSKATFAASAERMQNAAPNPLTQIQTIAEQSPEPMKSWLIAISQQTWHFMLQDSAQYIENAWQKEIMPTYHAEIANRYPFNQTATEEVALSQFTAFLGQQGLVANFYQHYFKPFINEIDSGWQWRVVDNQKIPFSDNTITQLSHAASLQRVFFPNGDNKLYVQFALQPISIDPNTKTFALNINGQQLSYQQSSPPASRMLSWPGSNTTHATSYNFTAPNNLPVSDTIKGDWSWFRLVTNTTKSINSRKEIVLTFNNGGHVAKYLLFTQGHMNPFLPLNLARLALPDQLG